MKEEWKEVSGYEGVYFVSNMGRIKSFKWHGRERVLKPKDNAKGYKFVTLWKNKEEYQHLYIHRMVLTAFVGPSDLEVNHKDNDRGNNLLSNLEWVTKSQNNIQRWKHLKDLGIKMFHNRKKPKTKALKAEGMK